MSSQPQRNSLRLGTRGSLLARAQSRLIADRLESLRPGLRVELAIVRTGGDRITDRPLHEFGGKGLFTRELEQALLAGEIDFAVHSFKDVPITMPLVESDRLIIAATPTREDPRDALICREASSVSQLPNGAKVGTGSLRRRCLLLWRRTELRIEPVRGNIDTRLRKLRDGEFDAIVLAAAGIRRAGLFDPEFMHLLDVSEMLPAPGQGALALQCRRENSFVREMLSELDHSATSIAVSAEREVVRLLNGDCHSPIAALGEIRGERLVLRAAVGRRDGLPPILTANAEGPVNDPLATARAVARQLLDQGAARALHDSASVRGEPGSPSN